MQVLESFQNKNLKYSFVNKFNYKFSSKLPQIKKIVLSFKGSQTNLKKIAILVLALRLVSSRAQKLKVTLARKPNLMLKIKKGAPIGCKITLSKNSTTLFLNKIIFQKIVIRSRDFKPNVHSFAINDPLKFKAMTTFYSLFSNLNSLNVNLVLSSNTKEETFFLLKKKKLVL